ncbi:MAG: hypothetical protein AB1449_15265 [Chloroflexota bacterium]
MPLGVEEEAPDGAEPGPEGGPTSTSQGLPSGLVCGGGAAAIIAAATAAALETQRRRREEEERLRAAMEARNTALRPKEEAPLAAAKARVEARLALGQILHQATGGERPSAEWLGGALAAVEAARRALEEGRTEKVEQALNEEQTRPSEADWEEDYRRCMAESERRRAEAQRLEAARQARATPTPPGRTTTPTATPQPPPVATPPPPSTPMPYPTPQTAASDRPWWERAIERLIMTPPYWLSLSYELKRDFNLASWGIDGM